MKTFILTVLFVFVAGIAFAAGIDGTWNGEVAGMGGGEPMKISYTFKADGKTLTGTTKDMNGEDMSIKDGKIDGNKISFSVKMNMGQNEMKIKYTGTVEGDELTLKMDMGGGMGGPGGGGMERALIAKRVK